MIVVEILNDSYIISAILNIIHDWLLWPVILISRIWFLTDYHILNPVFIYSCRLAPTIVRQSWWCPIIYTIDHRFHSLPCTYRLRLIHIPLWLKVRIKIWLISSSSWRHVLLWNWMTVNTRTLDFRKLPGVTNSVRIQFLVVALRIPWT